MASEFGQSPSGRWLGVLKSTLESAGKEGAEAARYLREHRIRIRARPQSAGARWTVGHRIEINPQYACDLIASPYALSLVIHEVRHLRQGALTALSVYGELDAWQVQFAFLHGLSVSPPGSSAQRDAIQRLMELPLGWDRNVLATARSLMREYAGKAYRVDLLPLYPVDRELVYVLTRRVPGPG